MHHEKQEELKKSLQQCMVSSLNNFKESQTNFKESVKVHVFLYTNKDSEKWSLIIFFKRKKHNQEANFILRKRVQNL